MALREAIREYLDHVAKTTQQGDAREESYYPFLKGLLEDAARQLGKSVQVTVLPKPTEAGNPDFRVWDGSHRVIGYVEAKTPGAKLDQVETSEQLQRYLHTFPNVILTDFYEFRLYRNGNLLERALLARPFIPQTLKAKPPAEQVEALTELLGTFFSFTLPPSFTAEDLARELARRTRFLRDQVIRPELAQKEGAIYGFYEAFQKYLIAGLTQEDFADLYAQTITYGLFAARTRAEGQFNRRAAFELIPSTIGILRDVFRFISLGEPSEQMETIVDDIAAVLDAADAQAILQQYFRQGKGDDPVLHFYETFLAEYDPETREQRGVYYTPQPVVRYIVRAVHELLNTRFSMHDGLADARVTLLDPAAGTLTFPAEAVQLAFREFVAKYGEGAKAQLRKHILDHFFAFELLMAPYAIGHMKIGFLFESLGIPLGQGERFQFYLTNALEIQDLEHAKIPGLAALADESHHAAKIKSSEPILVILGNPPYSGHSANKNLWAEQLKTDLDGVQSYYTVDGKPLGEKNPKMLQDDYVKFLRFAQWKINKAGRGIVAMITNHGYLDNPTFRGMRQSLLESFDEIFVLDLHGNSLKKETAPDGGPDENVFDIRVGVAIGIFVKNKRPANSKREESGAKVYHADLYGSRAEKYAWLEACGLDTAGYRPIFPVSPFYFFTPRDTQNLECYRSWPSVPEIFPANSVGIVTTRDGFVIAFDQTDLRNRILQFQNTRGLPDHVLAQAYELKDKPGWSLASARKQVEADVSALSRIHSILYRPFDVRYIFYHEAVVERPRAGVMHHMLDGENLGLVVPRRVEHMGTWQHAFVTALISEHVAVSLKTSDYHFPLYLYPSAASPGMFHQERRPNLAPWLLPQLSAAYGFMPSPEEVLAYIYAVLYSPPYRERYAQELRTDFPRLPFTADGALFRQMAAVGQQLIELHLLRNPQNTAGVRFQGEGSDLVDKVRYEPASGRVYINTGKYFEGITREMWGYRIGGYQVLEKYLKDRKGRELEDPLRYIAIASAIARTIQLQAELEELFPAVEANTLCFPGSGSGAG